MFIKSWRDNFDTWSYVHWIGTAYLAATMGVWQVGCFAVGWEILDWLWSIFRPGFHPSLYMTPAKFKARIKSIGYVDRILDNRGASFGDLLIDSLGILTWYCHSHFGWPAGLGMAAVAVGTIELSRKG